MTLMALTTFTASVSAEMLGGLQRNLSYGMRGPEVKALQTFLAEDRSIYPEGLVTGWFGPLTRRAVIRFQEKYAADILTPLGLTAGTGFMGSRTRALLNSLRLSADVPALPRDAAAPSRGTSLQSLSRLNDPGSKSALPSVGSAVSSSGGGGAATHNAAVAEPPRVKIQDVGATHRCAVQPFSVRVAGNRSAGAVVSLTPSVTGRTFRILVGDLPTGVRVTTEATTGVAPRNVVLSFSADVSASTGSYNVVFVYEEDDGQGSGRRNFCQANVIIE